MNLHCSRSNTQTLPAPTRPKEIKPDPVYYDGLSLDPRYCLDKKGKSYHHHSRVPPDLSLTKAKHRVIIQYNQQICRTGSEDEKFKIQQVYHN